MKQTQATAIHYRRSVSRAASKGAASSSEANPLFARAQLPQNNESASARQIGELLLTLAAFAVLIVLGASWYHVIATHGAQASRENRSKQLSQLNDRATQQLKIDLSDSTLAADIATVRACQRALTTQLRITSAKLESDPRDRTLLERRELIEVLLTNAGGTGVNDQLAAVENAQRMVASDTVSTQDDEATVRRVMADLRGYTESWKSGALANAGRLVGLRWDQGNGLATSTPYIWGATGWEVDRVTPDTSQKR